MPGAGAALFLYHRYFFRVNIRFGERLSRFPPVSTGAPLRDAHARAVSDDAKAARAFARFDDNYK